MDYEKLQQLIELSKQYQTNQFWNQVFESNFNNVHSQMNNKSFEQDVSTYFSYASNFPFVDLYEADKALIIEIEVPGLNDEDISFSIDDKRLLIEGRIDTFKEGVRYFLKERANRTFEKSIPLPHEVDINKMGRVMRDGVLYVKFPLQNDE